MVEGLVDGMIGATLIGPHVHRMRTFAIDRVCSAPGCAARLSIYNPEGRCGLHHLEAPVRFVVRHRFVDGGSHPRVAA